jgi:hypothetical protein
MTITPRQVTTSFDSLQVVGMMLLHICILDIYKEKRKIRCDNNKSKKPRDGLSHETLLPFEKRKKHPISRSLH